MTHLLLPVSIGIIASLAIFLYFESQAIAAKRRSNQSGTEISDVSLCVNFERYDTKRNVKLYFISMFVITIIIAYTMFFSKDLTLVDVFLYVFSVSFIGSSIIFALKMKKSILVKVFAAFLYGAPLIGSSALGFIVSYGLFG